MNIKFVLIGLLIIAGLFFFSEKYFQHQMEEKFRQEAKQLKYDDVKAGIAQSGLPIEGDLINQYPNLIVYVRLTTYEKSTIPEAMKELMKKVPCMQLEQLKNGDPDQTGAIIRVLDKDKISWTYIMKNKYHKELYQYKQVVAECPDFAQLKNLS